MIRLGLELKAHVALSIELFKGLTLFFLKDNIFLSLGSFINGVINCVALGTYSL